MVSLCDRYLPREHYKERIEQMSHDHNKCKALVGTRALALGVGAGTVVLHAFDLIIGVNVGLFSALSGGKIVRATKLSTDSLDSGQNLGSDIFLYSLKVLNPKAQIEEKNNDIHIFSTVTDFFKQRIITASAKEGFFQKHFVSRGYAFGGMISAIFVRTIGLLVGVISAAVAFACLGQYKQANNLAYLGFRIVGLLKDEMYFGTRLVNPGLMK